jgi:hypothetical protein
VPRRLARIACRKIKRAAEPHDQRNRGFRFERHVGEHAGHHRLVNEPLLEHDTVARVMQRLDQRHTHQPR